IASAFCCWIARIVYPVIHFVVLLFKPLTMFPNSFTGLITRALTKGQKRDLSISKEDLRTMVDISGAEGAFLQGESYRIKGVFDFYHLNVKDVLKTPRVEKIGRASCRERR